MKVIQGLKNIVSRALRSRNFEIRRIRGPESEPSVPVPYVENPTCGPVNMTEKIARLDAGQVFEWPDMVVLNKVVAGLIRPGARVVELGSGTGRFAAEIARDSTIRLFCSEFDVDALTWAQRNRASENVTFSSKLPQAEDGPFDVVVAIDVIEHVPDFAQFLETCRSLAPMAILTTPNKARVLPQRWDGPPEYRFHVREWNAGEFFWVLRSFYSTVELFSMTEPMTEKLVPISVTSRRTPLIGVCRLDQ